MTQRVAEHLAMAEMLWASLHGLNRADPQETGDSDLAWYWTDNRHSAVAAGEDLSPYAHVWAALKYSLTKLTGSDEWAYALYSLLSDNGESVAYNLAQLYEAEIIEHCPGCASDGPGHLPTCPCAYSDHVVPDVVLRIARCTNRWHRSASIHGAMTCPECPDGLPADQVRKGLS